MSDGLIVALIAGGVALGVAYVNGFLVESYRRFRDGSALAASLAGELAAYEPAWPMLVQMIDQIVVSIDAQKRPPAWLRPFDRPKDLVYENSVGKLGLLGAEIAESVVFVYSNIGAFRVAMEIVAHHEKEMSDDELRARCLACKAALERAVSRGSDLLRALRERSIQPFVPEWPWAAWVALLGRPFA